MDNQMLCMHDMVIGASKSQYLEIAKTCDIDEGFFVENSLVRGGCFWSSRYKIPIPGKLDGGNRISAELFIERLKNTKKSWVNLK